MAIGSFDYPSGLPKPIAVIGNAAVRTATEVTKTANSNAGFLLL
jgi:hypothetical protein